MFKTCSAVPAVVIVSTSTKIQTISERLASSPEDTFLNKMSDKFVFLSQFYVNSEK